MHAAEEVAAALGLVAADASGAYVLTGLGRLALRTGLDARYALAAIEAWRAYDQTFVLEALVLAQESETDASAEGVDAEPRRRRSFVDLQNAMESWDNAAAG